jgi:hypothetical protein
MLSPRRRQVIIAGLGTAVAPAAFAALPAIEAPQKLLLFMLVTSTPRYRVSYRARATEGTVSNSRPDADGMGRASIGLTLV